MAGHLRQRGGSWELVAYAGRDPLTGKRRYVSRAFRGSKREAQAALDRLVVEVDDGVEGGSVGTVGELLDRYVEVFGPTWSPSTLRQTVSAIERHLRPRWGQVQLRRSRRSTSTGSTPSSAAVGDRGASRWPGPR